MQKPKLLDKLFQLYRLVFVRRLFYRLHYALFKIGLHGIGLQNFDERYDLSGEVGFLRRHLGAIGPRAVVFDVGANEGQYIRSVRNFAPDAIIHAFEPHPQTFGRLQKIADATSIHLNNLGCGGESAKTTLFDYGPEGSQHASVHNGVFQNIHSTQPTPIEISITTLDQYCADRGITKIDLLKIDTEGNEYAVLRGASKLLASGGISTIHFEFNEMNVYSRVFFKDFLDLLPDFDFYRMLPDGLVKLGTYRADIYELFAYQNVVAIRRQLH